MSEEQNQEPKVNNELTERVNKASVANNFTLLNGGTDNIIMISGDKDGVTTDILVTYDGLEQVVQELKADIKNAESSNES
jgi:hypothetical protein